MRFNNGTELCIDSLNRLSNCFSSCAIGVCISFNFSMKNGYITMAFKAVKIAINIGNRL